MVFLFAATLGSFAAQTAGAPSPASTELFKWFDQLPLPDVKDLPFIEIWTGHSTSKPSGLPLYTTIQGFLLKDEGPAFTAVMRDLTTVTFAKSGNTPNTEGFVGYRIASLEAEVRRILPTLGDEKAFFLGHDEADDHLNPVGELFALARTCERRGRADLSNAIFKKLPQARKAMDDGASQWSLRELLEEEFAKLLFRLAMYDFQKANHSREDLVSECRKIEDLCPKAESELKEVRGCREALESQLSKDAAHRPVSDAELAKLPPDQRAAEWIYRLRDETLHHADPEQRYADKEELLPSNGAYAALVSMGIEAVPALLSALDSRDRTRTVMTNGLWDEIWLSPVREEAIDALNAIAGFQFNRGNIKVEAAKWFERVSRNDEKGYLIDRLRAERTIDVAQRLLKKYSDEGASAIRDIMPGVGIFERYNLIAQLGAHDSPVCREILSQEMMHGSVLCNRVQAATVLDHFGVPDAALAMRAEWQKALPTLPATTYDERSWDSPVFLVRFLVFSAAPEGPGTFIGATDRLPLAWRLDLIYEMVGRNLPKEPPPISAATLLAMEEVLIELLTDTTPISDARGILLAKSPEPRICDLAAETLHKLSPNKYHFDVNAPPGARDRQCIQFANLRAQELGKPVRDVPPELPAKHLAPAHACDIAAIEWKVDSVTPPAAWRARVAKMKGAPLNAAALISLLCDYAKRPLPGTKGIRFELLRYDDFSGVKLTIELEKGIPPTSPSPGVPSFGICSIGSDKGDRRKLSDLAKADEWKTLSEVIADFRKAPPDKAFEFAAEIALE